MNIVVPDDFPPTYVSADQGDLKRLAVRSVTDSFELFRYDEVYMVNHQRALQARWRADARLLTSGASDQPLMFLTMHS